MDNKSIVRTVAFCKLAVGAHHIVTPTLLGARRGTGRTGPLERAVAPTEP
jgi:hypothetical protein